MVLPSHHLHKAAIIAAAAAGKTGYHPTYILLHLASSEPVEVMAS